VTGLVITGWGALSAAGIGTEALARALAAGARPAPDVSGLYPEPMPLPDGFALVDFDVRQLLGRKGTSFLDRASALAMVACGQAIGHSRLVVDEQTRYRIGIALGTTLGSFRSSSDYCRETLVADRPYLVNPVLFPNTVMNCAAGQSAIRYGLHGVNGTVAAGRLGFLGALRYGANALRRGHAEAMLVGAVEEFTPHAAWLHHRLGRPGLPGEAAVVFVVEPADAAALAGRPPLARVLGVSAGYHPDRDGGALADTVTAVARRALEQADRKPGEVTYLTAAEDDDAAGCAMEGAVAAALEPKTTRRSGVRLALGDCGAAAGALQLGAALLTSGDAGPTLLTGWSPDGSVGSIVVESHAGVGTDRQ
jgi:3-oxoacyl-[acyl-carrier-protein] synthase II